MILMLYFWLQMHLEGGFNQFSGIILPHDQYRSHLNKSGITIDDYLEKENFKFEGETLSEIWSNISNDRFPVVTKYIVPEKISQIHWKSRTALVCTSSANK